MHSPGLQLAGSGPPGSSVRGLLLRDEIHLLAATCLGVHLLRRTWARRLIDKCCSALLTLIPISCSSRHGVSFCRQGRQTPDLLTSCEVRRAHHSALGPTKAGPVSNAPIVSSRSLSRWPTFTLPADSAGGRRCRLGSQSEEGGEVGDVCRSGGPVGEDAVRGSGHQMDLGLRHHGLQTDRMLRRERWVTGRVGLQDREWDAHGKVGVISVERSARDGRILHFRVATKKRIDPPLHHRIGRVVGRGAATR